MGEREGEIMREVCTDSEGDRGKVVINSLYKAEKAPISPQLLGGRRGIRPHIQSQNPMKVQEIPKLSLLSHPFLLSLVSHCCPSLLSPSPSFYTMSSMPWTDSHLSSHISSIITRMLTVEWICALPYSDFDPNHCTSSSGRFSGWWIGGLQISPNYEWHGLEESSSSRPSRLQDTTTEYNFNDFPPLNMQPIWPCRNEVWSRSGWTVVVGDGGGDWGSSHWRLPLPQRGPSVSSPLGRW